MQLNSFKNIFLGLSFGLASFVLFHFFSLVGFFVAFSYPIWWLFFPKLTWCVSCRIHKHGETCTWCDRPVEIPNGQYPKSLKSVVLNVLVLLLLTVISFTAVLIETRIFARMGLLGTPKTASFILPNKRQFKTLEIFPLKVEVSGIQTPINAIQIDLGFDPTKLQVVKVDIEDSFANIFIERQIDNEKGFVRITGGLPNPGFSGSQGNFATVYFQGQVPGPAQVAFLPTSLVMANDGLGTNILTEYQTINYLILPESLSSSEQDSQIILVDESVLGISTESEKIIFFEDEPIEKPQVLGSSTEESQNIFVKIGLKILQTWNWYNLRVVEFWKKIFT